MLPVFYHYPLAAFAICIYREKDSFDKQNQKAKNDHGNQHFDAKPSLKLTRENKECTTWQKILAAMYYQIQFKLVCLTIGSKNVLRSISIRLNH